jgi:hypothetical protein
MDSAPAEPERLADRVRHVPERRLAVLHEAEEPRLGPLHGEQ